MVDKDKANRRLTTLLVSLLIDAAAIYGIVWLVRGIGAMAGWWR